MNESACTIAWDQKIKSTMNAEIIYGQYAKVRSEMGATELMARTESATPCTTDIRRNSISRVN